MLRNQLLDNSEISKRLSEFGCQDESNIITYRENFISFLEKLYEDSHEVGLIEKSKQLCNLLLNKDNLTHLLTGLWILHSNQIPVFISYYEQVSGNILSLTDVSIMENISQENFISEVEKYLNI